MREHTNNHIFSSCDEGIAKLLEKERFYVPEAARTFLISRLPGITGKRVIFVPCKGSLIEDYSYEIRTFSCSEVFEFPDFETLPHERGKVFSPLQAKRLNFLKNFFESKRSIGVVHPGSFLRKFPPPDLFEPERIVVKKGDEYPFEKLIAELSKMGYERVEVCEVEGTYSVRGGIVDVYPAGSESPFRIEFFGDEVEDIREFDIVNQTSIKSIEKVEIGWFRDTPPFDVKDLDSAVLNQVSELERQNFSLNGYWPLLFKKMDALVDFLRNREVLFVFENLESLSADVEKMYENLKEPLGSGFAPFDSADEYFVRPEQVLDLFYSSDFIEIGYLSGTSADVIFEEVEKRALRDRILFQDYLKRSEKVFVIAGADLCRERIEKSVKKILEKDRKGYEIVEGYLRSGFLLLKEKALFLPAFFFTGGQVMMKAKKQVRLKGAEFLDLKPLDYVVHPRYGIGRYEGIEKQARDGIVKEYVVIEYLDGRIKIPLENADLITKYYGDEERVQLDRIGSKEWQKAKQKAQKSARKLAFDLLKVYAKRNLVRRKPYDISNPWIYEFESLFPYEETLDQASAINDVYLDMSSEYPMERLVIGDVGYGKTEVAMRASFVAVVNGKQVIVMAPTTVLSEQHYENWKERFQHFPVTIGYISRFESPSKRRKTIEEFNLGRIDILIGTHAVLSKEIRLDNVSLVIIDEEHRFGVNQKEYFKARKPEIDVLMLSATPIPRTLQMALSGLKPISLIETPPPGRLPVITYVGDYDETMVLSALKRELERKGQALYVHNDISKLPKIAHYLAAKLEGARVAFAHGQMPERKLEKTMVDFWEGRYDILVCTTIIESGLDMPNVNTLVVDGAEKLGLAQAYQLRGRVGRSYRQAYAYFMTRKKLLTEKEEKRLKALLELSGWGSGYRLALRDLEIRGAGNLLGPEQHGHMMRVGISYFLELLRQEVESLKLKTRKVSETELYVDIPVDIHIPDEYISSLRLKYEVYRRAAGLENLEEARKLKEELMDRFGKLPREVEDLLYYGLVRNLARKAGINYIKYSGGTLTLRGKISAAVLTKEIPKLKNARGMLNQVSIDVPKSKILMFLYEVFADIISKIKTERSS